jgi:hypothetical protein
LPAIVKSREETRGREKRRIARSRRSFSRCKSILAYANIADGKNCLAYSRPRTGSRVRSVSIPVWNFVKFLRGELMAGATLIIQRLKRLSSSPSVHSSHDRTTLARRTSGEACPLAGHFIRERAQRARHSNRGLITLQGRSGGEKREKGNKKEKKGEEADTERVTNYYIYGVVLARYRRRRRAALARHSRGMQDDADDAFRSLRRFVRMSNVGDFPRAPVPRARRAARAGNVGEL